MEEIKTKVCNVCKRELPIDAFNKKTMAIDGLQPTCRECQREANRKFYETRKTKKNTLHKLYTDERLATFSPRQLMAELKARGFVWDYMEEPRKKIMYNKI
jgi:hypothetical protein